MQKKILFNIIFWFFLWILFFLTMLRFEPIVESIKFSALIVLPYIIPVYIHDYIFDYFVLKKHYFLYVLITLVLVLFFGYITDQFQNFVEPNGDSETYGALLLMMILYTGAKYFRIGTIQRMKLKEEEEKRIRVEMELKEMEAKQAHAELDLLKSQVNPHFLFNSLNSIYSLILNNSEISGDAVLKLSDLMRYLLESSKKRKVLVKHEIQFLENYIALEKIRLGKKCSVSSSFKGDFHGKIISPMLLIPFIENCFKHGISVSSSENNIEISIEIKENSLLLHTRNKIAPKRISSNDKKTKTGIENVKKRLALIYPKKHYLLIKESNKQFLVDLKIEI